MTNAFHINQPRSALTALRTPTAEELHHLLDVGCWEWHIASGLFTWSASLYDIFGLDPATFTPTTHSILDHVAPQDVQAVMDTWWKDNTGGPPRGMVECRIIRPDGALRWIRFAWHTVDAHTSDAKVFGVAQDITALRAATQDEAHYRGIVECSSDYTWEYREGPGLVPPDGLTLRVFGAERAGPLPPGAAGPVVEPTAAFDFAPLVSAVAARDKFRDVLLPILDAAGEPRWVNLSGHPQYDCDGTFYGYRGVGADVTDRMRQRDMEEDRRQAGALGRLASGLAHEINNLLQPIMIYAAFGVEEARDDEKLRLYFSRITRAAERATFVVKNVLSFARKSPPAQEDLNVVTAVRETIDLLSGMTQGRVHVDLVAADVDVIAQVERTGLAQIVTNLIANAGDAMAAGGRIVVRVESVTLAGEAAKAAAVAPGCYAGITVEDSGPGIPPDVLAQVFDPFFTTKPQGKGTGLGLAVVSGLARSWGGGVAADSAPGQGSRFTVYLPLAGWRLQAAQ